MAEMGHNIHHPKQNKEFTEWDPSNCYALSSSIDHAKLRLQPWWHSPLLAANNDGETILVK